MCAALHRVLAVAIVLLFCSFSEFLFESLHTTNEFLIV